MKLRLKVAPGPARRVPLSYKSSNLAHSQEVTVSQTLTLQKQEEAESTIKLNLLALKYSNDQEDNDKRKINTISLLDSLPEELQQTLQEKFPDLKALAEEARKPKVTEAPKEIKPKHSPEQIEAFGLCQIQFIVAKQEFQIGKKQNQSFIDASSVFHQNFQILAEDQKLQFIETQVQQKWQSLKMQLKEAQAEQDQDLHLEYSKLILSRMQQLEAFCISLFGSDLIESLQLLTDDIRQQFDDTEQDILKLESKSQL